MEEGACGGASADFPVLKGRISRCQNGYALLVVLITTLVLFSVAALATSAAFHLRQANRHALHSLQARALTVEVK